MQRWGLFVVWVVATVAVTVAAWRVVLAADAQVSDRPPTQLVAVPSTAARPTITVPESSTTSLVLDPEAPTTTTTSTSVPDDATSSTTSTTESVGSSSSTSTTSIGAIVAYQTERIPTSGGSVWVEYRPGEVRFVTAVPNLGWSWELRREDPDNIEVTFSRGDSEIRVRARWNDGEFGWEIDD